MKYRVATPIKLPPSRSSKSGRPEKTTWAQIGKAWSDDVGGKITVALNSLPFRSEFIYLFPVSEEDEREYDADDFGKEIT